MKFVSRRKEFTLVIRPTDRIIDESRRPVILQGEKAEFWNHQFWTKDQSLIDYLLKHPLYGREFTAEKGGDAIPVVKESMVFYDDAEITGKKVTAGFPEKNVKMISGALSTSDSPLKEQTAEIKSVGNQSPTTLITKDEVAQMIDEKMEGLLTKISDIVSPAYVKHKKFHCPICREEFSSGFKIREHKLEKHPELFADKKAE